MGRANPPLTLSLYNHLKLSIVRFSMSQLVQDEIDNMLSLARYAERQIQLESNIPTTMLFEGDTRILRHIIINTLDNALKYSQQDVHIILELEAAYLRFVVRDEGIGIKPEDCENILTPFYRGDNVANIKGTGLGLSIVSDYVAIHQGMMAIESQEGQGTQVEILLPFVLQHAEDNTPIYTFSLQSDADTNN
jgi:signal transduction histidine kinase